MVVLATDAAEIVLHHLAEGFKHVDMFLRRLFFHFFCELFLVHVAEKNGFVELERVYDSNPLLLLPPLSLPLHFILKAEYFFA